MHHERGHQEEDREEQSAEICINAKCDVEAANKDHQTCDDDCQLRCGNLLELGVTRHGFHLGEVGEAGGDEDQREENSTDDEQDIHGFLSSEWESR